MERLPDLLGGEPVYWIDGVTDVGGGWLCTELGFSDIAAHPYERLVEGAAEMLLRVQGIDDVLHEDREVLYVTSRDVKPGQIADLVDRYWFDHLPTTPIDPGYGIEPSEVLASPWPASPPPPRGVIPAAERDPDAEPRLREVLALPPSRKRMWTYLVFGAIPAVGGLALAVTPGGSNGMVPLALGAVNLTIGTRIALRRRRLRATPVR